MPSLAHKDDYLETPNNLIWILQNWTKLKFTIDVCATEQNKKCPRYVSEDQNALTYNFNKNSVLFCNPPRSENKEFVLKMWRQWQLKNNDIVMLLCWNDIGNKYFNDIRPLILNGTFPVFNLGKPIFWKNGVKTDFPARLSYFALWFKKRN